MANKYSAKRNPYTFFTLPESLEVLDVLPPELHDKADEARYFISLLVFKASHQSSIETNGYSSLNAAILNQIMDFRVRRRILDCLLESSVIECDGIYSPGQKSFGYRLHRRFANDRAKTIVATNQRIIGRLDRFYDHKTSEDNRLWLPVHHRLFEEQFKLEIDREQADEIVANLTPKKVGKTKNQEHIARHSRLSQSALVNAIAGKHHKQRVGTTGRVYNCITSLNRELRQALRNEGNPLGSVDISNAQPALLAKPVSDNQGNRNEGNREQRTRKQDKRENNKEESNQSNGNGEQQQRTEAIGGRTDTRQPSTGNQQQQRGTTATSKPGHRDTLYDDRLQEENRDTLYDEHFPEDLVRYIDLTSKGGFYKYMYEKAGGVIPLDEIKRKFLTDIFAKKRWVLTKSGTVVHRDYDSLVERVFQREFPTICSYICETNRENAENGITYLTSHSVLIRKLQELESKLVVEDAAVRAFSHPSNPFVLTLHDALFCGAGESELMAEMLQQAAQNQGYKITTKIERW